MKTHFLTKTVKSNTHQQRHIVAHKLTLKVHTELTLVDRTVAYTDMLVR